MSKRPPSAETENLRLNEAEARTVVFVRVVEESQKLGLLSPAQGRRATTRAIEAGATGHELLIQRANELYSELEGDSPGIARLKGVVRPRAYGAALAILGLLLGLATNVIAAGREINVLAFPLLLLIVWNVGVLLVWPVAKRLLGSGGQGLSTWVGDFVRSRAVRRLAGVLGRAEEFEPARLELARGFTSRWFEISRPLVAARAERALHLAAAALVTGVVLGLYVRGLALEITAGWQSTFLEQGQVEALLRFALAPGVAVLGFPELRPSQMEAAHWIHLYALTAAILVVFPRLAFSLRAAARVRSLTHDFPLRIEGDSYYARLLAPQRGGGQSATVLAYSFRPSAQLSETLEALLLDHLGNRARIEQAPTAPYGAGGEEDAAVHPEPRFNLRVVLFNLAQSPEQEVHGPFLEEECARVRQTEGGQLVVVVSEQAFLQRLSSGEEGERRLGERRRSWRRVLESLGLTGFFFGSDGGDDDLAQLQAALWPAAGSESLGSGGRVR